MKNKIGFFTLLMATWMITGCGSSSSGGGSNPGATVTVNGKNPVDYYNQFLYKTTGSCEKKDLQFVYLGSSSRLINKLQGREIRAVLTLFMRADSKYQALYEEHSVVQYLPNGYSYDVLFKKELSGTYNVTADGKIEFSNLGAGTALNYNDADSISLVVDRDINTPGLQNTNYVMRLVSSVSSGIDTVEGYCAGR